MRGGRWVASLWISCASPRAWTPTEISLLELIAERSWLAVEKLKTEDEMRLSQARFSRFMANLPGLAWIKDTFGRYVYANEAAVKAFNPPGGRLLGRTDEDLFPPETATDFRANDLKVACEKKSMQTVETLAHEDGTLHHSIVTKFPILGPEGQTALIGGMAIDITEQRRAEQEMRLISRMPAENPHPVMRISPDGEILYANDAARPLLDFWKRKSGFELPREFRERLHEAFRAEMRQETEIEFDGRTIVATIAPIAEGGYVNVYGIDITDRKQAEEALREKETELQLIADTTPLVLARCGSDLRYKFINQAGADVLGLPFKEIIGRRIDDVMGPEAFAVIEPYVRQVLSGEHVEFEVRVPYKTGPKWMRVSYVPERGPGNDVTGWIASITDITEVRLAQEAPARLAAIVEYSEDAIISKDINGVITSWNKGAQNLFGYTADETIGQPVTMLIPPERVDEEPEILARIRKGEPIEHYERCADERTASSSTSR
jgi:PAS domain S-box-containing protein